MTLVAAILSLLLLVLLVALVASAVWTARGAAKRAACKTNLQQLVSALRMYDQSNGGYPPDYYECPGDGGAGARLVLWRDLIRTGVPDERTFICPADKAAAAAEASRPPESRSGATACSYDYVYWQQSQAVDSGGGRAEQASGRAPFTRPERAGAAPLLVCRHHDAPEGDSAPWGLVAYEDGSIVWQQIPLPRGRGPLSPAERGPATGPMATSDAVPAPTLGGSERASRRHPPFEPAPASSARRDDRASRRSR